MKKIKMKTAKNYAALFSLVIGTLSALFLGIGTLIISTQASRISSQQAEMDDYYRPLIYTITSIPSSYSYEIFDSATNHSVTIPAFSKEISVIHGGIRELTVLCYDDDSGLCENESQLLTPDGKKIIIDVPPNPVPLVDGDIYYEFYFLLIESSKNEMYIDLICTEISLSQGRIVDEYRWPVNKLLNLTMSKNLPAAHMEMLKDYAAVRSELSDLLNPALREEG